MVETSHGGGVRARIQISEGLTGKFWAFHGLPLYEFANNVNPVCGGLKALVDNGGGEFSEIGSNPYDAMGKLSSGRAKPR